MAISMTEAAEILGVTRQRVHQMIQRGDFPTVGRFGSMLMLEREEVEKIKAHREAVVAEMTQGGSTIFAAQQVVGKREIRAWQKANRAARAAEHAARAAEWRAHSGSAPDREMKKS